MKQVIVLAIALFVCGCMEATQNTSVQQENAAGITKDYELPPVPAIPGPGASSVPNKPDFQIPDERPCVRCQFTDEEREIAEHIGKEIEARHAAYEKFIKEGMSEEEAVRRAYVDNYR